MSTPEARRMPIIEDYKRVVIEEPGDGYSGPLVLELPAGLDLEEAARRWELSGGQVRFFGEVVEQETVGLFQWLISQEGARLPQSGEQAQASIE